MRCPGAELLREMIVFAVERLLEIEVGVLSGAGHGEKSQIRLVQRNHIFHDRGGVRAESPPLDAIYAVIFFDALRVKIRDESVVKNKAVLDCESHKRVWALERVVPPFARLQKNPASSHSTTRSSGSRLTFESRLGVPPTWCRAILAHATRNFEHSQAGRAAATGGIGERPKRRP